MATLVLDQWFSNWIFLNNHFVLQLGMQTSMRNLNAHYPLGTW